MMRVVSSGLLGLSAILGVAASPLSGEYQHSPRHETALEKRTTYTNARFTWYPTDTGADACTGKNHKDSDFLVALNMPLFGSNGNGHCGKQIKITANGKTTTATIADACATCYSASDIDMTKGLWEYFAGDDLDKGVFYGTWQFVDGSSDNTPTPKPSPKPTPTPTPTPKSSPAPPKQSSPPKESSEPKPSPAKSSSTSEPAKETPKATLKASPSPKPEQPKPSPTPTPAPSHDDGDDDDDDDDEDVPFCDEIGDDDDDTPEPAPKPSPPAYVPPPKVPAPKPSPSSAKAVKPSTVSVPSITIATVPSGASTIFDSSPLPSAPAATSDADTTSPYAPPANVGGDPSATGSLSDIQGGIGNNGPLSGSAAALSLNKLALAMTALAILAVQAF